MGEYADMMINGEVCQGCGLPFEENQGHPAYCSACWQTRRLSLPRPQRPHTGDKSRSKLIKPKLEEGK